MAAPPFHPEWLVTFWLTTPGLNKVDPHLVLALLAVLIALFVWKKRKNTTGIHDREEERFQHLLTKKKILQKELMDLERKFEQDFVSKDEFQQKKKELSRLLEETEQDLQQFT